MLLDVRDIVKRFPGEAGPVSVLDGVTFSLTNGESIALTGESGSGKSTLLHIVGALEPADAGEVSLNGKVVSGLPDRDAARMRRETIGIVFQQFNLIPSLDVERNLSFQARLAGCEDAAWTGHLADALGLQDHLRQYPETLSGGQQQRVAIGRALAHRPALLLADEPTGNLDEDTATRVTDLLRDLAADAGTGVLMVTHSERLAARMDRRLHLSHGRLT